MKSFKTLREDALKKIKVGKVFEPTSSDDNKKDPAFSKKGKVATGDEGQLKYGSKNNDVHVTEEVDLDQKYADWQDEVKQRNPQHAAKIKFKTNPDQRDTISAEHGDRSFGTFNTKTGEAIHLGEATEGNKFESAYDVVAHLAKAGYRGIQAKDVELYQGGRATARHRGSSASQHYGKYFSVNAAGVVKVHGDGASAAKAMKEEFDLEEDYGYENRTAKDAHLTYTQYMRKYYPSKYKGMWESEDCRVCGQTPCNCTFINESYYNISGIVNNKKFNVKLNPTKHYGNQVAQQNSHLSNDEADAVGRHLDHPKSETQDRTSEYNGHVVSTKISDVGINEDYKEKNYEYKNKDGRTATLSCATYSDGDAEHFVHIKGQRATRHSTKEKAHQSLRVRGYEPTGKVEEE